jgi:hypothetical protein
MKHFNKLAPWLRWSICGVLVAFLTVFSIKVETDYAKAAQGIPMFKVSGGVGAGSLVNSAGRVGFTSHEYLNEIREGNIAGHTFVRIEANNNALGTTFGEVSELGTAGFGNWPAAEGIITIVSDSAQDSTGGTGALTVTLDVLDSTFTAPAVAPVITMQGLNSVFTLDSWFRINNITVTTSGTGLTNAGTITAYIGGNPIIALQDGHSKTTEGRITVPADNTLYLQDAEGSVIGTNKNATFHLFTRADGAGAPFILQQIWQAQAGGYSPDGKVAAIPEKTDVIIIGQGSATGNDAAASMQGWLEE